MIVTESLQLRVHGVEASSTLIYLPGLHGDWTLLGPFRAALGGSARLVETTYPRRPEWTLDDYAAALEIGLRERGIERGWLLAESFSSQIAWQLLGRHEAGERFLQTSSSRVEPLNRGRDALPRVQADRQVGPTRFGEPDRQVGPAGFGEGTKRVQIAGLILVGGFVKHPWPWGVRIAHGASRATPLWLLKRLCALYGKSANRRCCATSETAAEIEEFVRRRTIQADRDVMSSRYRLIRGADFRAVARRTRLPVFHLSGAFDPLVPWWQVVAWLKKECPGFRASRIVRRAGHNVLLDAPSESVKQILEWIK